MRDKLYTQLSRALPDLRLNGDALRRLPNNLNLTLPGVEAEPLVLYLDEDGVTIGTGAACSSQTLEPSHVLRALGISSDLALASIRITLGRETTSTDITTVATRIIKRVRWLKEQTSS